MRCLSGSRGPVRTDENHCFEYDVADYSYYQQVEGR